MPPTRPATAIAPPGPHTRDLRKALRPCPRLPADGGDRHHRLPRSDARRWRSRGLPRARPRPSLRRAGVGRVHFHQDHGPSLCRTSRRHDLPRVRAPARAGRNRHRSGGLHRRRPSPLRLHPVGAPERRASARRLPRAGGPAIPGLPRAGTGPPGSRLPRSAVPSRAGTGARPGARNRARNGDGRPRAPGTRQPSLRSACA